MTKLISDTYLSEQAEEKKIAGAEIKFIENVLFSCYCKCGQELLRYLNVVLVLETFEHIFYGYRPGADYNKKSLNI